MNEEGLMDKSRRLFLVSLSAGAATGLVLADSVSAFAQAGVQVGQMCIRDSTQTARVGCPDLERPQNFRFAISPGLRGVVAVSYTHLFSDGRRTADYC